MGNPVAVGKAFLTILLLEDNPAFADLLREWLVDAALLQGPLTLLSRSQLLWEQRLETVLARLRKERFDVILADLNLPDSSGLGTVDALLDAAPQTPLVVLSGLDDELLAIEAVRRGAQDYLLKKDVESGLLGRAIRYAVERNKAEVMVERQAHQLAAANRELESFAYSIAHDLRAPLGNIRGFARILMEDHADELSPAGRTHLKWLLDSAIQMETRIADYLKLSRSARGKLQRQLVDLSAQAVAVAHDLGQQHPDRRVEWVIEPGLQAMGDPGFLAVVLENLLGNAWKFTAQRDPARIAFGVTVDREGKPCFFVRDNGAGFDPEGADDLFVPFLRLHSQEEFPGTGIGLATVQRIIQRHGGAVWAESQPDQGATFFFSLGSRRAYTVP
ncbi:MAG: response regulator [Magnetococcales bacterium]|nr:response regulator [Magnetococcales bacterium]